MEFLSEYGLFLAKVVTAVVAIVILVGAIVAISQRSRKEGEEGHIEVTNLNHRYEDWEDAIQYSLMNETEYKKHHKERQKKEKAERKGKVPTEDKKRIFVLDFDGDIRASAVEHLRREISAVLTIARDKDEVLLRLESPGGMVHSYGLAASQLARIRERGIPLTIAIDRVAASGGYMMACIGNRLLAAPFAILGSIGVVAQMPNFHRLLKKHDIDVELHTAGEHKRTLTMVGENTEAGRRKFLEELEDTHQLFKEFVKEHRPQLDVDGIATGEVWFGQRALDKQLIDELGTSDDYLLKQRQDADLYAVRYRQKRRIQEKLGLAAEATVERSLWKVVDQLKSNRYWSL